MPCSSRARARRRWPVRFRNRTTGPSGAPRGRTLHRPPPRRGDRCRGLPVGCRPPHRRRAVIPPAPGRRRAPGPTVSGGSRPSSVCCGSSGDTASAPIARAGRGDLHRPHPGTGAQGGERGGVRLDDEGDDARAAGRQAGRLGGRHRGGATRGRPRLLPRLVARPGLGEAEGRDGVDRARGVERHPAQRRLHPRQRHPEHGLPGRRPGARDGRRRAGEILLDRELHQRGPRPGRSRRHHGGARQVPRDGLPRRRPETGGVGAPGHAPRRRAAGPGHPRGQQGDHQHDGEHDRHRRPAQGGPLVGLVPGRVQLAARRVSSAPARSAGGSLTYSTQRPSPGWWKPRRWACSHWRVRPRVRASVGSAP